MPTPYTWSPVRAISFSDDQNINSVLGGTRWASRTVSFSFGTLGSLWSTDPLTGYGPANGTAPPWALGAGYLDDAQRAAVRLAMEAWQHVSGLTLVEYAETSKLAGDIRFAISSETVEPGAEAFAYLPSEAAYAGDVWFSTAMPPGDWLPGSHQGMVVLHEIGHALGLKHPFQGSHAAEIDTRSFTVMSYSAKPGDASTGFSFEPTTPMLLDIAAIQRLYGVNTTTNAGDTAYVFASGTNYHQTLWDAGGEDSILCDGDAACVIDLRGGYNGSRLGAPLNILDLESGAVLGTAPNVWIAFDTLIENAIGGGGDDTLTGNAASNQLTGSGGADAMTGDTGADTLLGGVGGDTLDAGDDADVDLLQGGAGDDRYLVAAGDLVSEAPGGGFDVVESRASLTLGENVEQLRLLAGTDARDGSGNAIANRIDGNEAANSLQGLGGSDTLTGSAGDDTLDGGAEHDVLIGGAGDDAYLVSDADQLRETGHGVDTVRASVDWTLAALFENLVLTGSALHGAGNSAANAMLGNDGANTLRGAGGDDTLDGGAGHDRLLGGVGADSFVVTPGDVCVESVDGGVDTVYSPFDWTLGSQLEHLVLTGADPVSAAGNVLANSISGNAAGNRLRGAGGRDTLDGGEGADTLAGGAGDDVFIVGPDDRVNERAGAGIDTVIGNLSAALFANVERLVLSEDAIEGHGNALANLVAGNSLDNTLEGGAGNDTLSGRGGLDTAIYPGAQGARAYDAAADGIGLVVSVEGLGTDVLDRIEQLDFDGSIVHLGRFAEIDAGTPVDIQAQSSYSRAPRLVQDGTGGATLVWIRYDTKLQNYLLEAQHIDAATAAAVGEPITLAVFGAGSDTSYPGGVALAANDAGDVLVAWVSAPGTEYRLMARTIAADGSLGEPAVLVAGYFDYLSQPTVSALAGGGFLVGWSQSPYVGDASLCVQSLSSTGALIDAPVALATDELGGFGAPSISHYLDGSLIASWTFARPGEEAEAFVQHIDASGAPLGNPLRIEYTGYAQTVAATVDGGFLIAWTGPSAVMAQRYDANGNALGDPVPVSEPDTHFDTLTGVVALEDGRCAVAFSTSHSEDIGESRVLIALIEVNGEVLGSPVEVGYAGPQYEMFPVLAATDGGLLVAWQVDKSGSGISTARIEIGASVQELRGDTQADLLSWRGAASVRLFGDEGSDTLEGGAGADLLRGDLGQDRLLGGEGSDSLSGGADADTLIGSAGADWFLFDSDPANIDRVEDFSAGEDRLVLDRSVFTAFAGSTTATMNAGRFWAAPGASLAHDDSDRIVYDTTSGRLYYDPDGIGGDGATCFAVLGTDAHPLLSVADFVLAGG